MPSRRDRSSTPARGQGLHGADDRRQGAAEPVQRRHHHGVPVAHVGEQRGQAGPVVAGPGEGVGEDPLAAGGGQRVLLCFEGLVISADPGVADL